MTESTAPTLPEIGAELRRTVKHLEVLASHVRVCVGMLQVQDADNDRDVVVVLRQTVGTSLYSQTRRLARLAARCDGQPVEADYTDEDDDSEGQAREGDE